MDGRPSNSGDGQLPASGRTGESSEGVSELAIDDLEQFLLDHAEEFDTRPRVGTSVALTVDESDCEQARIALRRVSVDAPVTREIGLAAIALEIALERPLACARNRKRPVTLAFDVADCVLMALALWYVGTERNVEDYRWQARTLLDRLDRSTPSSVDGPFV